MPEKYEISETEFLQNQQLRKTIGTLLGNPKSKLLIQQAQRVIDPNVAAPELDAEAKISAPVEALTKQITDLKADIESREQKRAQEATLGSLKARQEQGFSQLAREKWTQAGIDGIKKLMEEKGLLDPLDAAAIYLRDNPPPTPINNSGHGAWNFLDLPTDGPAAADLKKLVETKGESAPLLDKMVRDALLEVRA